MKQFLLAVLFLMTIGMISLHAHHYSLQLTDGHHQVKEYMQFIPETEVDIPLPFKVGDKKYYYTEIEENNATNNSRVIQLWKYHVSSKDSEGYIIEAELLFCKDDNPDEKDLSQSINDIFIGMLENNVLRFRTNQNGEITSLINSEVVEDKGMKFVAKAMFALYSKYPQIIEDLATQIAITDQAKAILSEDKLIEIMTRESCPIGLSGILYNKKIKSNMKENVTNVNHFKLLRNYSINPQDDMNIEIVMETKLNMTMAERKQMVFEQMSAEFPDEIDEIRDKIDIIIKEMGIDKLEASTTTQYIIGDKSSWPISIVSVEESTGYSPSYIVKLLDEETIKKIGLE